MHYGAYAFAKNRSKKTIITKNGASIGQRKHMTALDAESVNTLYDCPTSPNPRPTPRPVQSPTPRPVRPPTPRPVQSPTPRPGGCKCSGKANSKGQGATCGSWCYTEPDACSDGKPSRIFPGQDWSYLACRGVCKCSGVKS